MERISKDLQTHIILGKPLLKNVRKDADSRVPSPEIQHEGEEL